MARVQIKASGLAGGLTVLGLLAILPVLFGLSMPQTGLAGQVDVAPIHEARADALAGLAATSEQDRAKAVMETRRSLAQAPANATAWLRLAYLDSLGDAGLTAEGDRAVAASYAVAPYGPDATPWRLAFTLNHWPELSSGTRASAIEEIGISTTSASRRHLMNQVSDPSGRLALVLVSQNIDRALASDPA